MNASLRIILLRLRGLYLMMGLAGGMMGPYLTSLFVHQGISSGQVGIVMAVGKIASIVVQPFWGMLVDKSGRTRLVLMLSLAVPAALAYFYNIPWFTGIIVIYMISTIFQATQAPIADSYAVTAAQEANTSYGKIRSMGSLGNALGGYAGGLYVSIFSITALWFPFMLLNAIGLLAVVTLPANTEKRTTVLSFSQGIRKLLSNRTFLFFLIGSFLINQTLTAFNTYFVLAFQMVGGSYAMSGVALLIASLTNVPAMLIAGNVIKRIGCERTLLLAAAAYVLRWFIQWLFPVPEVMVGVQVLHGLSFGFFYVAAVEFVSGSSGKEMRATGQSVFTMVFSGLGGILGNLLNGYLLNIGGPTLMHVFCMVSAFIGMLFLCVVVISKRSEVKRGKAAAS